MGAAVIRVLVVDDEKLVRKGIIGTIDWQKYGMEVIGEAENGTAALDFLKSNEVDLMFSDLGMPGLSGMDFIKKVRLHFPELCIVVLTMHQDFEYVQQALRFGVMDYITKTQIERENVDALMKNIVERYGSAKKSNELFTMNCEYDNITVIYPLNDEGGERAVFLLKEKRMNFKKIHTLNILYSKDIESSFYSVIEKEKNIITLEIAGAKEKSFLDISDMVLSIVKHKLFFDYIPPKRRYEYSLDEETKENSEISRTEVLERCKSMRFVLDDEFFYETIEMLKELSLPSDEQAAYFYPLNIYWSQMTGADYSKYFEETAGFVWWYQWVEWLDKNREQGIRAANSGAFGMYDEEIRKAIAYLHENMDKEIALANLLYLTNMSKSLFCKHFKRITGDTFVGYLNRIRINAAKKLLINTEKPVYQVAEQVGFKSERYFRKVFFESTGEKPKKYRENDK